MELFRLLRRWNLIEMRRQRTALPRSTIITRSSASKHLADVSRDGVIGAIDLLRTRTPYSELEKQKVEE